MPDSVVRAFGRLHVTLIDLGRATARAYGGCGFAIGLPVAAVRVARNRDFTWQGLEHIDSQGQKDVKAAVARLEAFVGSPVAASVTIRKAVRQHVGLGSKTALVLAILTGLRQELALAVTDAELQRLSGRGGASGIGIHTFFCGGFIVDAGHPQAEVDRLAPSSARRVGRVPPVIARLGIPASWRFWLILPPGPRIAGTDEMAFFARSTPIPPVDVQECLALVAHGIAPAVATGDLEALATSLRGVNARAFKAREVGEQSVEVRTLLQTCWSSPAVAAGLSSMGPLVYVIADLPELPSKIREAAQACGAEILGPVHGRNDGAVIEVR